MAVIEFGMAPLLKQACKDVEVGIDDLSSNLDQSTRFSDKEVLVVPRQSLTRSRVVSQLKRIPKYSSCLDWTQSRCTILDPVGDHLLGRQHHFTTSITLSSVTNIYKHSPDHKCRYYRYAWTGFWSTVQTAGRQSALFQVTHPVVRLIDKHPIGLFSHQATKQGFWCR